MPAYDKPIQFIPQPHVQCKRDVAATIRFTSTDMVRIRDYLARMVEHGVIAGYEVGSYDARETSPTLYFP